MHYSNNTYHIANPKNLVLLGSPTISRLDRRCFPSSRVNSGEVYPAIENLVLRMERAEGDCDTLSEFYNTDAIFGFAIRAHLQLAANRSEDCENQHLTQILDIGTHDWKGEDRSGNSGGSGGVPYAIRYAAVLGSQLLERIWSSEAKVRIPRICRVTGLLIAELSSAGRAGAGMGCTIAGLQRYHLQNLGVGGPVCRMTRSGGEVLGGLDRGLDGAGPRCRPRYAHARAEA